MDIGVPLRDLGPVDVSGIAEVVKGLSEADWTANMFRQDALASKVHSATDNIVMKTEWHPSATSTGIGHFEDLVHVWAKERGLDPKNYLPIARENTDVWPVYTMPDWLRYKDVLQPVIDQVLAYLKQPGGIITRLALVRLRGGANIAPHIDQHAMAAKALETTTKAIPNVPEFLPVVDVLSAAMSDIVTSGAKIPDALNGAVVQATRVIRRGG